MQSQLSSELSNLNPTSNILNINDLSLSDISKTKNDGTNVNSFLSKKTTRKAQNSREWTKDEERMLLKLNEVYPHNWRQISRLIKTKTPIQCSYKYEKISTESKADKFSRREDIILIELVNKFGKNWEKISSLMQQKYRADSLRRRYFEKLLPGLAMENNKKDNNDDCNDSIRPMNNKSDFLYPNSYESETVSLPSLLSHNHKKVLFTVQSENLTNISGEMLTKSNQILRRIYKRLIQIYQIVINLDYSKHSVVKALLIEKKKELCLQVKNYKFKFNVIKVLRIMNELEETIKFAKAKIHLYLDHNKNNVLHSPV